jgi:hypothetical protein
MSDSSSSPLSAVGGRRAADDDRLALGKLPFEVGLVEEDEMDHTRLVPRGDRENAVPPDPSPERNGQHGRDEGRRGAGLQPGDRDEGAAVVVRSGDVPDEILDGLDPQPGEEHLPCRTDTLDELAALEERMPPYLLLHKYLAIIETIL